MNDRKQFLIHMYDQLFNDINRHILVIWQSLTFLAGLSTILILQSKGILPASISTAMIIVILSWIIAHVIDSSFWYNRNLVIIANIEKQFLGENDLHLIHPYFGTHRRNNKMISHLKLQCYAAIGIGSILVIYYFYKLLHDGIEDLLCCLPLIILILSLFLLYIFKKKKDNSYKEFIEKSPGKLIKGEKFNHGHGGS